MESAGVPWQDLRRGKSDLQSGVRVFGRFGAHEFSSVLEFKPNEAPSQAHRFNFRSPIPGQGRPGQRTCLTGIQSLRGFGQILLGVQGVEFLRIPGFPA